MNWKLESIPIASRFRPAAWAGLGLAAAAGYYLVSRHWTHVVDVLPWVFLALCPLLHLLMHGSHGGHGGRGDDSRHQGPQDGSASKP